MAASNIAVRSGAAADVDRVAAIERASFSDPWSSASFVALLGRSHVCFAIAEDVAGAAVGYVIVWHAGDESEIANIAVDPSLRGRKIGALLLDSALAEAAREGAISVFLEVRESNTAARRLYESRAFAPVGRRRNYYRRPSEDALVLRRELHIEPVESAMEAASDATRLDMQPK